MFCVSNVHTQADHYIRLIFLLDTYRPPLSFQSRSIHIRHQYLESRTASSHYERSPMASLVTHSNCSDRKSTTRNWGSWCSSWPRWAEVSKTLWHCPSQAWAEQPKWSEEWHRRLPDCTQWLDSTRSCQNLLRQALESAIFRRKSPLRTVIGVAADSLPVIGQIKIGVVHCRVEFVINTHKVPIPALMNRWECLSSHVLVVTKTIAATCRANVHQRPRIFLLRVHNTGAWYFADACLGQHALTDSVPSLSHVSHKWSRE